MWAMWRTQEEPRLSSSPRQTYQGDLYPGKEVTTFIKRAHGSDGVYYYNLLDTNHIPPPPFLLTPEYWVLVGMLT